MNESDSQFVKSKVDAELKLDDITHTVKRVPVKGNGKRKGKRMLLRDFVASYQGDMHDVYMQARSMRYEDKTVTDMFVTGWDSMQSQERHQRQGGAFMHMPPTDPKERMKQLRRRADEKMLFRETCELQLRGLKTELAACERARWDKNAEIAGKADSTIKALKERQIPRVEQTLRTAKEDEDNAVRDLRNARDTPMLGGLQKVSRGSAED
jgi:hypothetical protein